ncbi:hypothetical protein FQA39_LY12812 [Lamprigera yunnana]|nr:hypothetical protein FQA39_LY12812 [Lamprigera yunnana]
MPIFFIPLVAGIGISVIFIYVLGGPIGFVMGEFSGVIQKAYQSEFGVGIGLGLGVLLGAMASFDMGGPINKIAFVTSSALITMGVAEPMGAMAAAIPVAPIGMGLTYCILQENSLQKMKEEWEYQLLLWNNCSMGGPIVAILGAVPYGMETFYYFIAAAAGVAVTVLTYGFLLMKTVGVPGSKQALHVGKN